MDALNGFSIEYRPKAIYAEERSIFRISDYNRFLWSISKRMEKSALDSIVKSLPYPVAQNADDIARFLQSYSVCGISAAGMGALFSGCLSASGADAQSANTGHRYNEAKVKFSQSNGFYDKSFSLELSYAIPEAVIKYTLDASSPSETHGLTYTAPIEIKTTTVVRAMAYKETTDPSRIGTRTYIFPEDVKRRSKPKDRLWPVFSINDQLMDYEMDPHITGHKDYSGRIVDALLAIPSISLVTDYRHLFDYMTGIHVNPLYKGKDWERPVSVEFLYPGSGAGGRIFQINSSCSSPARASGRRV